MVNVRAIHINFGSMCCISGAEIPNKSSQMGSLARTGSVVTVNGPNPNRFSARTLNR